MAVLETVETLFLNCGRKKKAKRVIFERFQGFQINQNSVSKGWVVNYASISNMHVTRDYDDFLC